ncbi:MAG: hypothetical protein PVF56_00585 [Desulfobacterales bacterium]|jgi:hypothetical protein
MTKKALRAVIFIGFIFAFAGCAGVQVYSSDPAIQKVGNDYFEIEFEPELAAGYHFFNGFRFVVTNKTDKDLKIAWEETYYLFNERRYGRFVGDMILTEEGLDFEKYKELSRGLVVTIPAGQTKSQLLYPLKLIARQPMVDPYGRQPKSRGGAYSPGPIPAGKSGIEFVVRQNGKEKREKLNVHLTAHNYSK